ncbi:MAG: NAD-dependent epimerase/dehydratase family protein [Saprospiraceae bacterium]|nr:NAD-dependent epimerase/dehydratase family protein [Saprospiraceae bacterium]
MQTILGAGGAIGNELARSLASYTDRIRLVSRNPSAINPTDELVSADLLNKEALFTAVKGSEVVYLTVGFPYNLKFWQTHWPSCMSNVIEACMLHDARLVFFDNMYMYDQNHLDYMTEDTPVNPPSKKGQVRSAIASMLWEKVENGSLTALIGRSADFYGPGIQNTSMLTETVFKPLSQGKKANWMGPLNCQHSFTFTPDAGKATAMLGNTKDAFGQIWHLPTAPDPFTGKEWIDTIASQMGLKPRAQVAAKWMVKMIGLFIPVMREMPEMMYQYNRDYVFNSDKFFNRFNMKATPYREGIKAIVESDYNP